VSESQSYFEVKRGSERGFGVVFTVVFLVIAFLPLATAGGGSVHYWALAVAGVFALITALAPGVLRPLNILWFKLGMLLGAIIAPLVMMVIFYGVVTPFGLAMRAFGKDPLLLKNKSDQNTYWIRREQGELESGSMKNQF
jgi:peptidoglycan/LPS O-acetylase OafA/YrhL